MKTWGTSFLIGMLVFYMSPSVMAEHDHEEHAGHEEHEGRHHEEEHEEDEHGHHDDPIVHLGEESQEIVDLKIVKVKKMPLLSAIEVVGDIAQDTENVTHVTAPQAGTLKSIRVHAGDTVDQGTLLAQMTTKEGAAIDIASPRHGIIMAQYAKENESVDVISSIMTIADPDLLRASFNVYEKDLAGIKPGLRVLVQSVAYPQKEFEGEIVFVSPQVDVKTRAVRVRANIRNDEHLLKFGMYVTGKIFVPISGEALILPEEALQEIKGQTVVFLPNPDEKDEFQIREIKVGRSTPGFIEVISGLEENQDIVGQGSFYLKSELLKGELGHGHAH